MKKNEQILERNFNPSVREETENDRNRNGDVELRVLPLVIILRATRVEVKNIRLTELSSKKTLSLLHRFERISCDSSTRKRQYYDCWTLQRSFSAFGWFRNCSGYIMMEGDRVNFIASSLPLLERSGVEPNYGESITTLVNNNSTPPAQIVPPISSAVHLGLAIVFTALYALLFLMILVQLCLILYFGHRRLSYQSVFLFIYLFWAALRTTLFSFYFNDIEKANHFGSFARWLLYALPIYLQFLTLTLLTLYLAKVRIAKI